MAIYTFNTTAGQETAITRARRIANQKGQNYPDNPTYIQALVTSAVTSEIASQRGQEVSDIHNAWATATDGQKDSVRTDLGLGALP